MSDTQNTAGQPLEQSASYEVQNVGETITINQRSFAQYCYDCLMSGISGMGTIARGTHGLATHAHEEWSEPVGGTLGHTGGFVIDTTASAVYAFFSRIFGDRDKKG